MFQNQTWRFTRFPGSNLTATLVNLCPYRSPKSFLTDRSSGRSPNLADANIKLDTASFMSLGQSLTSTNQKIDVSKYKILLHSRTFDTTKVRHTCFSGCKEG